MKKKEKEREREGNARGLREKCIDTARSRASKVLLSLLLSSSSPNPLSSLSLLRALPRRKENPLKRFTHSITKKKKYSPRWHERIIHASAVRPGRLRVHVVVEIETLLVRRFHAGHSRRHIFFLNLLLYKLSLYRGHAIDRSILFLVTILNFGVTRVFTKRKKIVFSKKISPP
jgi:hypothetical protein